MARQEERKERTRQRLLAAATRVFVRDGYGGASLQAVASQAGYTKGAVYAHFGNKENLFFEVFAQRAREQLEMSRRGTPRRSAKARSDGRRWTVLVLEFVLYAVRTPKAMRRLRAFFRENREMIARSLVGAAHPDEVASLGRELQILDLGYSLLSLVDDDLKIDTYRDVMASMLARHGMS